MSRHSVIPDGRRPSRDRQPAKARLSSSPLGGDDPFSSLRSGRDDARFPGLSLRSPLASALRLPILAYRYSLSLLIGRQCRYLPTCSEFADEALARHGTWAGGWMAAGRICRCHPWGGDGFDPVPRALPSDAAWSRPWRYARRAEFRCERAPDAGDAA